MSTPTEIEVPSAASLSDPPRALIDAVMAGHDIVVTCVAEGISVLYTAAELAGQLDLTIEDDPDKDKREAAELRLTDKAMRAQESPTKARRLLTLGRHPETDMLTAVFAVRDGHEVEFITPSGDTKKRAL